MADWLRQTGPAVRFTYFNRVVIIVGSAEMAHAVFASRLSNYRKDQASYKVFGDLLGSGLVTSEDEVWRRGRSLIAPPFKREVLHAVVGLSIAAAQRVAATLRKAMESDTAFDLAEEFRHMTLQVIGEAVLSMTPEECDATLPALYLPIVEEANVRAWFAIRAWLPLPATFHYNRCVRQLNTFVVDLIKRRIASKHVDENARPRIAEIADGACHIAGRGGVCVCVCSGV
jgi:cytochrome P450